MRSTRPVTGVAITGVTTILRDKHWQVSEMSERTKAEDPMAAVRVYIDAFNKRGREGGRWVETGESDRAELKHWLQVRNIPQALAIRARILTRRF
jgi:hypothetical protein